jgi:Fe2+ or Zn2+ uptake regulation protein
VDSVPAAVADAFASDLNETYGFSTDIAHVSIHGRCSNCERIIDPIREVQEDE